MVEDTALFVRSVGEDTDIVGKEMYTFEDKGGRSLSLRPEGHRAGGARVHRALGAQQRAGDALVLHRARCSATSG